MYQGAICVGGILSFLKSHTSVDEGLTWGIRDLSWPKKLEIVVSGRVLEYFSMLASESDPTEVEGDGWIHVVQHYLEKEMISAAHTCSHSWGNSSTDTVNNLTAAALS